MSLEFEFDSCDILVSSSLSEIVLAKSSFRFLCSWLLGWWTRARTLISGFDLAGGRHKIILCLYLL
jgi:hypothetical protein